MQPFSPSPIGFLAALTPAEQMAKVQQLVPLMTQALKDNAKTLILLFVLGQVATVLCNWGASKIVAQEESRFVNAVKTYFFFLGMCFLISIAGGLTIVAAARFGGPQAAGTGLIAAGVALLFGILIIASGFVVPMKVYKISFPHSLAFVAITFVLQVACNIALNQTLGRDLTAKLVPLQTAILNIAQSATGQTAAPSAAASSDANSDERIAADKTRSITARQAALSDLYGKLEAMYQSLPPGQSAARAEYDARKARYEGLLADLRADAARGR